MHKDIRPHKCNHCKKKFGSSGELKSHGRCLECGEQFDCREIVKQHFNDNHKVWEQYMLLNLFSNVDSKLNGFWGELASDQITAKSALCNVQE